MLNAAWAMIDDMVNFAIFAPVGENTSDTNLSPRTGETIRLFNILLTDFLSPLTAKGQESLPFGLPKPHRNSTSSDFTFLFYLKTVCDQPSFGSDIQALSKSVARFSDWLETRSEIESVLFPSLEAELGLTVERREWIRICGDGLKHGFLRLEGNVKKAARILKDNGYEVQDGLEWAALPELVERFHTDFFEYHASTIAEFLNNIRWDIYEYLRPEYYRARRDIDTPPGYRFDVPEAITHPFAVAMYREAMGRCRATPFFPRFSVTEYLKIRY